jgi:hypothetical protein
MCIRDSFPHRKRICEALASIFNGLKAKGELPDAWMEYRTVYVLKPSKNGEAQNPADPDKHRPISIGNTVLKIFGLVLTVRISHWAVAHDIIGPEQVGFMESHSAEEHVATLTESVRYRWRQKLHTYAVFADFSKAYDRVHPKALWHALSAMGLDAGLIALLRDWNERRQTVVMVNGEPTAPVRMRMGVGQGDVLSPLLFNLFIESLVRSLNDSLARGFGITLKAPGAGGASLRLRALLYADDVVLLAESWWGAKLGAEALRAWSDAWGM